MIGMPEDAPEVGALLVIERAGVVRHFVVMNVVELEAGYSCELLPDPSESCLPGDA